MATNHEARVTAEQQHTADMLSQLGKLVVTDLAGVKAGSIYVSPAGDAYLAGKPNFDCPTLPLQRLGDN